MAKYSYEELKKAAAAGRRIGNWHGIEVYACSKYDYDASSRKYWVLYDDGNKLVYGGYCEGTISNIGNVKENVKYWYNVPLRKSEMVTKVVPASSGYSAEVITDEFFSRVDKEINELLAGIDDLDLLAGLPKVEA